MKKIAVVDTMFARGDMGKTAVETIIKTAKANRWKVQIMRVTVPGVKDLPVAVLNLLDRGCSAGLVFGMPGKMPIDKQCSHEASMALQQAQLLARKPILEVFVHEDEAKNDEELGKIMHNRTTKHALNLLWLLFAPQELTKRAGSAERQGKDNSTSVKVVA